MPQGKETVSDQEIIDAVENHEDPVVSAAEIAEVFGHTRQWAHGRLQDLADHGPVVKKVAGARSVVWWVAEGTEEEEKGD